MQLRQSMLESRQKEKVFSKMRNCQIRHGKRSVDVEVYVEYIIRNFFYSELAAWSWLLLPFNELLKFVLK